ncbi:hypothetical protein [Cupriavidus necator]
MQKYSRNYLSAFPALQEIAQTARSHMVTFMPEDHSIQSSRAIVANLINSRAINQLYLESPMQQDGFNYNQRLQEYATQVNRGSPLTSIQTHNVREMFASTNRPNLNPGEYQLGDLAVVALQNGIQVFSADLPLEQQRQIIQQSGENALRTGAGMQARNEVFATTLFQYLQGSSHALVLAGEHHIAGEMLPDPQNPAVMIRQNQQNTIPQIWSSITCRILCMCMTCTRGLCAKQLRKHPRVWPTSARQPRISLIPADRACRRWHGT